MTKDLLKDYIDCGREIEFKYNENMYSITYSPADQEDFISFCEFYKKPTNVKTFEELLDVSRDGATVLQMWESLTEEDVWIY
ncbi:MAG: hypothetical protein IKH67_04310 [Lachnospiraceae bacterium]|nr:hypothetical protein [Lachnospiraceae bacterium]